jgi:hypothetical protein
MLQNEGIDECGLEFVKVLQCLSYMGLKLAFLELFDPDILAPNCGLDIEGEVNPNWLCLALDMEN